MTLLQIPYHKAYQRSARIYITYYILYLLFMPSQIIRIFVLCLSLGRPCRCICDFAGSSLDHVSFEEAPRGSDWTQSPRYLRKVGGVGKTTGGYEGKRQKTGTLRVRKAVGWRLMDFNSELNMNWAVCFERTIGSNTLAGRTKEHQSTPLRKPQTRRSGIITWVSWRRLSNASKRPMKRAPGTCLLAVEGHHNSRGVKWWDIE